MPNRFQTNQYRAIYPFIAERDGDYCIVCFCKYGQRRGPAQVNIEIDHADGDKSNWSPANLHLVCGQHNKELRSLSSRQHVSVMAAYSAENENERKRLNLHESEGRRSGTYKHGSSEMQVNVIALRKWREFVYGWIKEIGHITKDVAISAGAIEADDVDIQTTTRYWKKDTSVSGSLREVVIDNAKCAVFREPSKIPFGGNGHKKNAYKCTTS